MGRNMIFAPRLCGCIFAMVLSQIPVNAMISRSDAELPEQFQRASTVFEGQVIAAESYADDKGAIKTRYSIRVKRPHKGTSPGLVSLTLPGGVVGNEADAVGCQPSLTVGQEHLFFFCEGDDGAPGLVAGSASVLKSGTPHFTHALRELESRSLTSPGPVPAVIDATANRPRGVDEPVVQAVSSSATNLLINNGIGARFLQPDQGMPIPYLVDVEALPAGISQTTALGAVSNALAAWETLSSVRFEYRGLQSFGKAASTVTINDGTLRIQLHDLYGAITGSTTLGIGGRSLTINNTSSDWTTGGQVFGNDFNKTTRGYVVLKHTNTSMQDPLTFEEVLCHEVGHALSMDHSTPNSPATSGTPAWEAQMYYLAHEDGRGAAPTGWDSNVLQQVHPTENTPPYLFDRIIEIVTDSPQPAVPGINAIELAGYDLQGPISSMATTDASAINGSWTATGTNLSYDANGVFDTGTGFPPEGTDFYEIIYARCSDGIHQSPHGRIRVLTYRPDSHPATSDGIPDYWMIDQFGSKSGASASGDNDLDTLSNIDEYRSGMNPTLDSSAQLINAAPDGTVSWQGKAYELYELQASTNLTDWFFVKAVRPTNDTPIVQVDPSTYDSVVYRSFKVP